MLLSNQKPDRLRDQASDRAVGVCRMGIHAVVSVHVVISVCVRVCKSAREN